MTPTHVPLIVQRSGNVQAILDLLGITQQQLFELAPTVVPVIQFERPDVTRQLRGAMGNSQISGVAAEVTKVQLFNPAGSGVLLHPEGILVSRETTGLVQLRTHDTALLAEATTKIFRDRRNATLPVGQLREVSAAGFVGALVLDIQVAAGDTVTIPLTADTVLDEGQGFIVNCDVVDVNLITNWYWSETTKAK